MLLIGLGNFFNVGWPELGRARIRQFTLILIANAKTYSTPNL